MKSWLFWVLVASEFSIVFSSGFLFCFFKNAVVCAGYVDFSCHVEVYR